MEIFGIPVFLIIIFVIAIWSDYSQKKQKEKKETAKKWGTISIGITKDVVIRRLGKPYRFWQAGEAEIWGYGPSDSDGQIRFLGEKVVVYQKPD